MYNIQGRKIFSIILEAIFYIYFYIRFRLLEIKKEANDIYLGTLFNTCVRICVFVYDILRSSPRMSVHIYYIYARDAYKNDGHGWS